MLYVLVILLLSVDGRSILPDKMYAIQNDALKFGNVIICGTRGWSIPENDFIEKSFLDFFNTVKKQHICVAYQGDSNCMLNTDAIYSLYMHPPISRKELLEAYQKSQKKEK